jgi:hypothetical protein
LKSGIIIIIIIINNFVTYQSAWYHISQYHTFNPSTAILPTNKQINLHHSARSLLRN